jgi:hypothetical protein
MLMRASTKYDSSKALLRAAHDLEVMPRPNVDKHPITPAAFPQKKIK